MCRLRREKALADEADLIVLFLRGLQIADYSVEELLGEGVRGSGKRLLPDTRVCGLAGLRELLDALAVCLASEPAGLVVEEDPAGRELGPLTSVESLVERGSEPEPTSREVLLSP